MADNTTTTTMQTGSGGGSGGSDKDISTSASNALEQMFDSWHDTAWKWKVQGNVKFMEGDFTGAVGCFTVALHHASGPLSVAAAAAAKQNQGSNDTGATKAASSISRLQQFSAASMSMDRPWETKEALQLREALLSNRGLCFLKLRRFVECVEDCSRVLSTNQAHSKTRARRAQALEHLGLLDLAIRDLEMLPPERFGPELVRVRAAAAERPR